MFMVQFLVRELTAARKGASNHDSAALVLPTVSSYRYPLTRTDLLNLRLLLYRPSLASMTRRRNLSVPSLTALEDPMDQCIDIATELVESITTSHVDGDDIMRASVFHMTYFLWNATLSLILYLVGNSLRPDSQPPRQEARQSISEALKFFARFEKSVIIARAAAQKSHRLMQNLDTLASATTLTPGAALPNDVELGDLMPDALPSPALDQPFGPDLEAYLFPVDYELGFNDIFKW